eukprot:9476168-Pyramimonas_sp.AAC.1
MGESNPLESDEVDKVFAVKGTGIRYTGPPWSSLQRRFSSIVLLRTSYVCVESSSPGLRPKPPRGANTSQSSRPLNGQGTLGMSFFLL